ncbi:DciA family protein [Hoeflea sp. WL0058]|uniref:DciA family protein n=1 Tax=Flavimaribacter sediminis TaxID=2865987 RepID=A0AAE2ZT85_9HYPH|nr:DciA family protein [Flavimaribacter sediminis]MBW8640123.1 DciA family protein [Flavimaribacter sediminis]
MVKNAGTKQISEIANALIDPVLAKRAGINTMLLGMWDEVVGPDYVDCTRPEAIKWPRRSGPDEQFVPGVLTIACEGARALFLAHETDQLIQRLNAVFGFPAVDRVKIVQKPVSAQPRRAARVRPMAPEQQGRLDRMLEQIEDDRLRQALDRLGKAVMTQPDAPRR